MPLSVKAEITASVLEWARRQSGYRPEDVAKAAGVAPEVYAQWETGGEQPSIRQLEKVAGKVKRPLAVFFLEHPPTEAVQTRDFRMLPSAEWRPFLPETLLALRTARNIQKEALELADDLREATETDIPAVQWRREPADDVAARLRDWLEIDVETQIGWRDSYMALGQWKAALERHAVIILQYPIPREDARAFSLHGESYPIIAVSSKETPQARCFSLFHELCHLAIGVADGVCGIDSRAEVQAAGPRRPRPKAYIEEYCNQVAASFLVPGNSEHVQAQLGWIVENGLISNERLRTVANRLKVSAEVVLRRLVSFQQITDGEYRQHAAQYRQKVVEPAAEKKKGGPDFVTVQVSQKGRKFTGLVVEALNQQRVTELEASRLIGVHVKHLEEVRDRLKAPGGPEE